MNQTVFLTLFGIAFVVAPMHAEPKPTRAQPLVLPENNMTPSTPRFHEFQGDEIGLVLRTLARAAKLNIVVSEQVTGTVTARIEDKTPRQAIEVIAAAKELILEDKDGILYVRPKNLPPPGTPKPPSPEKSLDEALNEIFTPTLTKVYDKVYDSILDYQARPETARKIAKAKKALYDALIAEGFTKEEAFRIVLTNQELSIPSTR